MPRAKPRQHYSALNWRGRIPLPDDGFEKLVEICGASDERREELREAVENAVGFYHWIHETVDKAPRPANILAALAPLEEHAARLQQTLVGLDALTEYRLLEEGFQATDGGKGLDLMNLTDQLLAAISKVRGRLGSAESRHRPTTQALRGAARGLRRVFGEFAELDLDPEPGEPPLRADSLRLDFVELALKAANESLPMPAFSTEFNALLPPFVLQPIEFPSRERLSRILAELDRNDEQ
jgi:hypothetical protein